MSTIIDSLASIEAAIGNVGSEGEALNVAVDLAEKAAVLKALSWRPYAWQRPHEHPDGFAGVCGPDCREFATLDIPLQALWLQLGGRGTGKTEGASRYVNHHVMDGPRCSARAPGGHRVVIVAPTQGDAVEACIEGETGLRAINPAVDLVTTRGRLMAIWPNGARARILGAHSAEDVERLRAAGNSCLIWWEELAAIPRLKDAMSIASPGLRLGPKPHQIGSTTPKPRKEVREVLADANTFVTRGRTRDATGLSADLRDYYLRKYGGTRLGRQELDAELLADVEGALWIHDGAERGVREDGLPDDRPDVESNRLPAGEVGWHSHDPNAPDLQFGRVAQRVVVSLDQSGGGERDEAGLGVIGSIGGTAYVLADMSAHMTTDTWARAAVQAYYDFGAEAIVTEKYGGDQTRVIIRGVTLEDGRTGANVPVVFVPTRVGKRLRAEPVQAVAQQGRLKLVGSFPELEAQMTGWVPDVSKDSPDRLDWMVHGVTYLIIRASAGTVSSPASVQMPRRVRRPGGR